MMMMVVMIVMIMGMMKVVMIVMKVVMMTMYRWFPAWKDEGGRALEADHSKTRATGLPSKP